MRIIKVVLFPGYLFIYNFCIRNTVSYTFTQSIDTFPSLLFYRSRDNELDDQLFSISCSVLFETITLSRCFSRLDSQHQLSVNRVFD